MVQAAAHKVTARARRFKTDHTRDMFLGTAMRPPREYTTLHCRSAVEIYTNIFVDSDMYIIYRGYIFFNAVSWSVPNDSYEPYAHITSMGNALGAKLKARARKCSRIRSPGEPIDALRQWGETVDSMLPCRAVRGRGVETCGHCVRLVLAFFLKYI